MPQTSLLAGVQLVFVHNLHRHGARSLQTRGEEHTCVGSLAWHGQVWVKVSRLGSGYVVCNTIETQICMQVYNTDTVTDADTESTDLTQQGVQMQPVVINQTRRGLARVGVPMSTGRTPTATTTAATARRDVHLLAAESQLPEATHGGVTVLVAVGLAARDMFISLDGMIVYFVLDVVVDETVGAVTVVHLPVVHHITSHHITPHDNTTQNDTSDDNKLCQKNC